MSSEGIALLFTQQPNPALLRYIENSIINDESFEESNCHKSARVTTQVSASVFLFAASLPFINASLTLAGNATVFNDILGWYLAACNITSFGILDAYSIINITDDIIQPVSEDEKEVSSACNSKNIELITKVISLGIACIVSVPRAYIGYTYNNESIPLSILAASGAIPVPTYSIYLSLNHARKNLFLDRVEFELRKSKSELVHLINEFCSSLPTLEKEQLLIKINEFKSIQQMEGSAIKAASLVELISTDRLETELCEKSRLSSVGELCVKVSASVLSISVLGYVGIISYNFTESITGSTACGVVSGGLVAGCSSYLTTKLLLDSSSSYYNTITNCMKRRAPNTWSHQYKAKATLSLKVITMIINSCAFGPTIQAIDDNFNKFSKLYMLSTVPLSFFLICSHLSLMLVDEAVEQYIIRADTGLLQEAIKMKQKLKKLSKLLNKSHLIEYAKLVSALSEDEIPNLRNNIFLTQENINTYINSFKKQ